MVVVAGTEHNTLDMIPMTPQCKGAAAVPESVQEIFWEGACVLAAHQFLVAHGEPGYVDAQGQLSPEYATTEERLTAFHQLGAAVIQTYNERVTS